MRVLGVLSSVSAVLAFIGSLGTYESAVFIIALAGLISGTVALIIAWRALTVSREVLAAQAERIDRLPPPGG